MAEWLLLIYSCLFYAEFAAGKQVKVKIVEEPAISYRGVNSFYQQQSQSSHVNKELKPRINPLAFSGPPHFRRLDGKCLHLIENSYKYEVCPFQNVTQREQTIRWNAFAGILGVFQGWDIVNNTFVSMVMTEGDDCPGNIARQTKVFFKCGREQKLLSVNEPSTCHYDMKVQTPLVCPEDAMLVYPTLSSEGRLKWENIERRLWNEELTKQGYNKRLNKLFVSEGLIASPDTKSSAVTHSKDTGKDKSSKNNDFTTLDQCSLAYGKLLKEVEQLRKLNSSFSHQTSPSTDIVGKTHNVTTLRP